MFCVVFFALVSCVVYCCVDINMYLCVVCVLLVYVFCVLIFVLLCRLMLCCDCVFSFVFRCFGVDCVGVLCFMLFDVWVNLYFVHCVVCIFLCVFVCSLLCCVMCFMICVGYIRCFVVVCVFMFAV